MMKSALKSLLFLLVIAYPALVYFALPHFSPRTIALILCVVMGLRWLTVDRSQQWHIPLLAGLLVALLTVILDSARILKWYPVLVSLCLLAIFMWSLRFPPSVIERIARTTDKTFTDEGIPYTRKLTMVWCLFFQCNATVAAITVLSGNDQLWALYNGLVSYVLIAVLFVGERLLRPMLTRRSSNKRP